MKCRSSIYHGWISIQIDDGDWKLWGVTFSIIIEDDGEIRDLIQIHAGERHSGIVYY